LADDYQLGNRLARKGYRIVLCPVVAGCWEAPAGWGAVWRHQLRWARTIRVCQPGPYFFSILSNPLVWPLLWACARPSAVSLGLLLFAIVLRLAITFDLARRLTQARAPASFCWLASWKDLLQLGIWFCAFAGNTVEWRGQRYALRRDGTLARV